MGGGGGGGGCAERGREKGGGGTRRRAARRNLTVLPIEKKRRGLLSLAYLTFAILYCGQTERTTVLLLVMMGRVIDC